MTPNAALMEEPQPWQLGLGLGGQTMGRQQSHLLAATLGSISTFPCLGPQPALPCPPAAGASGTPFLMPARPRACSHSASQLAQAPGAESFCSLPHLGSPGEAGSEHAGFQSRFLPLTDANTRRSLCPVQTGSAYLAVRAKELPVNQRGSGCGEVVPGEAQVRWRGAPHNVPAWEKRE